MWLGSSQTVLSRVKKDENIVNIGSSMMQRLNLFPSNIRSLEVQFENETGFGQAVSSV